jgi:hypothetical protein
MVLVGNAAAFVDQLRRAGIGRVEVVRLTDLDLTAADFTRKDRSGTPTGAPDGRH